MIQMIPQIIQLLPNAGNRQHAIRYLVAYWYWLQCYSKSAHIFPRLFVIDGFRRIIQLDYDFTGSLFIHLRASLIILSKQIIYLALPHFDFQHFYINITRFLISVRTINRQFVPFNPTPLYKAHSGLILIDPSETSTKTKIVTKLLIVQ